MDEPVNSDNPEQSVTPELNSTANVETTEDVPCDKPKPEIVIRFPGKTARPKIDGATPTEGENSGPHEKRTDFLLQLMIAVNDLRQTDQLCDIMLQSGSVLIPAHRNILASSSPYFHAMLTGAMRESSSECIAVSSIDGIILKQLVDFIYTGEITVTEDNVQALLAAANLSQLMDVRDICCRFLESRLHPTNCLGIWRFAEQLSCKQLSDASRKFAEKRYSEVCKNNSEFLDLTAEELEKFISNEQLCASEDCIFESVRLWDEHEPLGRAKFAESLYRHVKFMHMSLEALIQLSKSKAFLDSRPVCKDLLLEGYMHRFLSMKENFPAASLQSKKRNQTGVWILSSVHRAPERPRRR